MSKSIVILCAILCALTLPVRAITFHDASNMVEDPQLRAAVVEFVSYLSSHGICTDSIEDLLPTIEFHRAGAEADGLVPKDSALYIPSLATYRLAISVEVDGGGRGIVWPDEQAHIVIKGPAAQAMLDRNFGAGTGIFPGPSDVFHELVHGMIRSANSLQWYRRITSGQEEPVVDTIGERASTRVLACQRFLAGDWRARGYFDSLLANVEADLQQHPTWRDTYNLLGLADKVLVDGVPDEWEGADCLIIADPQGDGGYDLNDQYYPGSDIARVQVYNDTRNVYFLVEMHGDPALDPFLDPSKAAQVEIFLDTDLNSQTGCYGKDLRGFLHFVYPGGLRGPFLGDTRQGCGWIGEVLRAAKAAEHTRFYEISIKMELLQAFHSVYDFGFSCWTSPPANSASWQMDNVLDEIYAFR